MKILDPFNSYCLDYAYYFSLTSLTFDAMLKYTKVKLELITNYDMYMIIERGFKVV